MLIEKGANVQMWHDSFPQTLKIGASMKIGNMRRIEYSQVVTGKEKEAENNIVPAARLEALGATMFKFARFGQRIL